MKRQMWAIRSQGGWLCTICGLRKEAISSFLRGTDKSWRWWKRKYGIRAVKVEVREL